MKIAWTTSTFGIDTLPSDWTVVPSPYGRRLSEEGALEFFSEEQPTGMIALLRRIAFSDADLRSGPWLKSPGRLPGAKSNVTLGCRTIGYDPFLTSNPAIRLMELDEILPSADVVTLHTAITDGQIAGAARDVHQEEPYEGPLAAMELEAVRNLDAALRGIFRPDFEGSSDEEAEHHSHLD